ncbi:MAG TPA: hypothetical protein VNQ81_02915 [Povalibacter sp.]|nr:hypothetical protein [Povalibacter sp.]
MKTRIAIGAALLLTIGTAVAGSLIYGQGRTTAPVDMTVPAAHPQQVTPEVIAMWKATASSSDYAAPRIPI